MKNFKSIIQFQAFFNSEDKCREFLEAERWNGTPACCFCGSTNVTRLKIRKRFQCNEKECRKQFSVLVQTVYENTKIPLTKWFLAQYILCNHSKGISSLQLAKMLDVRQATAWFLNHRIREMLTENKPELLSGIVEVDESWVGGKLKNIHASKRKDLNGNSNKTMVFGALERGGKKVRTKVVPDSQKETLVNAVKETIAEGSIMLSDEQAAYKALGKDYQHASVNHSKEEYVRGLVHVNALEGFWGLLKRQIIGIHHFTSPKHLQRYCNEAAYRYNQKALCQDEKFTNAFKNCEKRLKYKDLIK